MKKYRNIFLLLSLILASGCNYEGHDSFREKKSNSSKLYLFKSKNILIFEEVDGNSEIVFDQNDSFSFTRTKNSGIEDRHFGQNILDCSNKNYYCIDGDLSFSLAKDLNSFSWKHNGYKCVKSYKKVGAGIVLKCTSLNNSRSTETHISEAGRVIEFQVRSSGKYYRYRSKDPNGWDINIKIRD